MIDPDRIIAEALGNPALAAFKGFFGTISLLGSASLWMVALAVCFVLNRWREIACVLFIALAFSTVINEDLKGIVQRIRPGDVTVAGYYVQKSFSFPSGHTQTAFTIATILSAFLARRYNIITYLLASAVGLSRVYLEVHYFTDVVAGAIVGVLLGILAIYGLNRLGLYDGKGVFEIAPRPMGNKAERGIDGPGSIRFVAITLIAGFILAMLAFSLSQYILSLFVIGITYILVLLLPALLRKRVSVTSSQ